MEYKDDQDWYVGSYSVFGGIRTLTDDELEFPLFDLLRDEGEDFHFQLLFYMVPATLTLFCGRYP